jgi:hypothetical protein
LLGDRVERGVRCPLQRQQRRAVGRFHEIRLYNFVSHCSPTTDSVRADRRTGCGRLPDQLRPVGAQPPQLRRDTVRAAEGGHRNIVARSVADEVVLDHDLVALSSAIRGQTRLAGRSRIATVTVLLTPVVTPLALPPARLARAPGARRRLGWLTGLACRCHPRAVVAGSSSWLRTARP